MLACSDYSLNKGVGDNLPEDSGLLSCPEGEVPADYSVPVDSSCLNEPTVGSFAPVVEWQWSSNPVHSGYHQIMSTPAIANLTDDDGDGDIDEDDIPDICFASFTGSAYTSPGTLSCISGDGSGTHWSITEAGGVQPYGSAGVAIGDIDADGSPEVCVASVSPAVLCLEADGSFKWAAGAEPSYVGCPAIADLDGDGRAEVIMGREILSSRGDVIATGAGGGGYKMSFAVDMDGDGLLEVIAGNTIYTLDGSILWTAPVGDTMPAVGDFDGDGLPDLVLAGAGSVSLVGNDGALRWTTGIYGGGNGGPPTVADFDGDGQPEIGVAGASYYTVYETDGSVRWAQPVSDYSSNVTGSSVFDFEGDGAAEVVYADEHTLWIYDGATGAVELQEEGHASGTLYEYPLIADVDRDGSTEIILPSNNYGISGWNGITVIGDEASSWAPARPIWNQFAYHITNVNNDGSIPAVQTENWLSWNNFRAGGTELGPSHWLADLLPGEPELCLEECAAGRVKLSLSVENRGLLDSRAFTVSLVQEDGIVAWTGSFLGLAAGGGTWTEEVWLDAETWGSGDLQLLVDPDDRVGECDERDNLRVLGRWPC
mgnify:CR=1 FL=1